MNNPLKKPIGWTDESDPNGAGYKVMTEYGIKTYDRDEYAEFCAEVERVNAVKKIVAGKPKEKQFRQEYLGSWVGD